MKTRISREKERYREARAKGLKDERWHERQTWHHGGRQNHLCLGCRTVFKKGKDRPWAPQPPYYTCPVCTRPLYHLGIILRAPRKRASEKMWRDFMGKLLWMRGQEEKYMTPTRSIK